MKIMLMHHVEEMWAETFKKYTGKSFDYFCESLAEHIFEEEYDRVIATVFELSFHPYNLISFYLQPVVTQIYEYAYGWDKDCAEQDPERFIEGGNHSECVMIEDWMKKLRGHEVYLCGIFDGECIEDIEIALEHCKVKFTRVEKFIY